MLSSILSQDRILDLIQEHIGSKVDRKKSLGDYSTILNLTLPLGFKYLKMPTYSEKIDFED